MQDFEANIVTFTANKYLLQISAPLTTNKNLSVYL